MLYHGLPTIALISAALNYQPVNAWFRVACTTPLVQGKSKLILIVSVLSDDSQNDSTQLSLLE